MFLIAGLGNPGTKYKNTRHNIGFMVIDEVAKSLDFTKINNSNFQAEVLKSNNIILTKPQTFMNESGQSIISIANYYNIPNDKIIVIHDDLDLSFGSVKFKLGGSHGGHNGLRSIDKHIGQDYIRIRIGIGKPTDKSQVVNYVLNDFSKEEFATMGTIISHVINSINAIKKLTLEEVKSQYTLKNKNIKE